MSCRNPDCTHPDCVEDRAEFDRIQIGDRVRILAIEGMAERYQSISGLGWNDGMNEQIETEGKVASVPKYIDGHLCADVDVGDGGMAWTWKVSDLEKVANYEPEIPSVDVEEKAFSRGYFAGQVTERLQRVIELLENDYAKTPEQLDEVIRLIEAAEWSARSIYDTFESEDE